MRLPVTLPIATKLWSARDPASAQIVAMAGTRIFQQPGRVAGTLNACNCQECPKRTKDLCCAAQSVAPLAPSASIRDATVDEPKTCGATKGQIDERVRVYRAELDANQLLPCSMRFDEAPQRYRAIPSGVEERKRTGTGCLRR